MKRSQKTQPSRKQRHIQTAKNLAKGLSPVSAMIEAGYSESYARSQDYAVVKRPYVRSIVTDAIEHVLKVQNKEFLDIIQPYIDGLDAPVVVKSPTEGTASIAVDPHTQQTIPDHDIRIKAADRIVALYGGVPKELEIPPLPARGLTVIIPKDGGNVQVNRQTNQMTVDRTKIVPTGESNGDVMPKSQDYTTAIMKRSCYALREEAAVRWGVVWRNTKGYRGSSPASRRSRSQNSER